MNILWENVFKKSEKANSIKACLKKNILFSDLSHFQINLVEKIVNVRHYRPGESIFKQGEVGVGMYLIVSGTVSIYLEEIEAATAESMISHVTQLKSGEFFGELALVENEGRRSASAKAHDECVLIGFYKPDLAEIIERNPLAGVKILSRLAEVLGLRLRETTAKITELKKEFQEK